MVLAGPPTEEIEPPDAVRRIAGGAAIAVAWCNALGGVTFEIDGESSHLFLKWAPSDSGLDLAAEAERMAWARLYTPVPRPVDHGADAEGCWLVTEAIGGESAVHYRWKAQPQLAVTAVGEGLRSMHDALPAADCPFSWTAQERIEDARQRADAGLIAPGEWHDDFRHLSVEEAIELLGDPPELDRLVVCHGDACCPNTLMGPDGGWVAHVDLGQLGVADRWADLAVATWSTSWNYGPGWETVLLDAYGVTADPERTHYYRLLWDLGA